MILTVILALLAPTLALAEPFEDQHGNWWDLPMPPARYFDRPYIGDIQVKHLPEEKIVNICSSATGKFENSGCSFPGGYVCRVYVSQELPEKFRKAVERHELAHCHGWPASHPEQ